MTYALGKFNPSFYLYFFFAVNAIFFIPYGHRSANHFVGLVFSSFLLWICVSYILFDVYKINFFKFVTFLKFKQARTLNFLDLLEIDSHNVFTILFFLSFMVIILGGMYFIFRKYFCQTTIALVMFIEIFVILGLSTKSIAWQYWLFELSGFLFLGIIFIHFFVNDKQLFEKIVKK